MSRERAAELPEIFDRFGGEYKGADRCKAAKRENRR